MRELRTLLYLPLYLNTENSLDMFGHTTYVHKVPGLKVERLTQYA